jgi:hypothetical protein
MYFGQALYVFDLNLTFYLWGYYIIGLLGFFLESYFRQIKPWLKISEKWGYHISIQKLP